MAHVPIIDELIEALRILPGVGRKSAQRMVYHFLQHNRAGAVRLGQLLIEVAQSTQQCCQCNNYSVDEICSICRNPNRDNSMLCIVETPADLMVIEQTHNYRGLYFVLMGRMDPIKGIGPKDLSFKPLLLRCADVNVREVIIASGFTTEGETTAYYLGEMLKRKCEHPIKITRLARGVPIGSDLEYVDASTIASALQDRREMTDSE